MSSRDPWSGIPNLTGVSAPVQEDGRSGDPSRFYASAGSGTVDAVTGRILNVPRVSVYRAGALSVPGTGYSIATWDTAEFDTESMWDGATRLKAKTSGLYLVVAWFAFQNSSVVGGRFINILKNSAVAYATMSFDPEAAATYPAMTTSAMIVLNAGDYVELQVYNSSGVGILSDTGHNNGFQACLISTFGSES